MRIGVDFDNTIVSYDTLFHRVAIEQGLIPAGLPQTKLAVRDYLRQQRREGGWTEKQGYVYGARMDEAEAYPGAIQFLQWASVRDLSVFIISHKTHHPFLGPQYNLHGAARLWVERHLNVGARPLVSAENVHFELTREEKLQRIRAVACDYYLDDLPEILFAPGFPDRARRILFDPDANHGDADSVYRMRTWTDILGHFQRECRATR